MYYRLLVIFTLGTIWRFTNLDRPPIWIDELATMVFSLGNRFSDIPVDEMIDWWQLMSLLKVDYSKSVGDSISSLIAEDHHPPLYFYLNYYWCRFFPTDVDGYLRVWTARSFSAIVGSLTILVAYWASLNCWQSRRTAEVTATLVAVSPYCFYLSREARHYGMAVLLCFLAIVGWTKYLRKDRHISGDTDDIEEMPISKIFQKPVFHLVLWMGSQAIGLLTNYFTIFAIAAETTSIWWFDRKKKNLDSHSHFGIYIIAASAIVSAAIGLLLTYKSTTTNWLTFSNSLDLLTPLLNTFLTLSSFVLTLPPIISTSTPLTIAIVASTACLIWIYRSTVWQTTIELYRQRSFPSNILLWTIPIAIGLQCIASWTIQLDATRATRYHYTYYCPIVLLLGYPISQIHSRRQLAIVYLASFLSCFPPYIHGSHSNYQSDRIPSLWQNDSPSVLIATTHHSLSDTTNLMTIADNIPKQDRSRVKFLLAHQSAVKCLKLPCQATTTLKRIASQQNNPTDLWTIDFQSPIILPPNFQYQRSGKIGQHTYINYRSFEGDFPTRSSS
jgi:uncharacterized membrane protein